MPKPTAEELALCAEWDQKHAAGMTYAQIGKQYNLTGDYVSSRLYRYRNHWKEKAPEFHAVDLGKPLELTGDWMIVGDVHVPTTDYELSRLMLTVARKHLSNPRLIIAGDFFSMDSFSNFEPTVTPPSWAQERDAGKRLLTEWLEVFGQIVAIQGNHDRRMTKKTMGAIEAQDIYRMLTGDERLTVSNFGHLTIQTDYGPYRVTHSRNYSVNQLTVASELANKFQSNIIEFHEHRLSKGWDKFGRYIIVQGGGLFDVSQMAYVQLDDGKNPVMNSGFILLRGGIPHLFGKTPFTDWSSWI